MSCRKGFVSHGAVVVSPERSEGSAARFVRPGSLGLAADAARNMTVVSAAPSAGIRIVRPPCRGVDPVTGVRAAAVRARLAPLLLDGQVAVLRSLARRCCVPDATTNFGLSVGVARACLSAGSRAAYSEVPLVVGLLSAVSVGFRIAVPVAVFGFSGVRDGS